MKRKSKYTFVVEITDTGFSAYSEESPIVTTGKNLTELQHNIQEALELASDSKTKSYEIKIDLKQFFQYYRIINSKFLAERIGMNQTLFSHYVQGRKKPSTKQTNRILLGINEIGRELSQIKLIND